MHIKFYSLFTLLFFYSCSEYSPASERPKNVILLISDGTGLSQISSAYFYKESEVNYSRFQHIGLITTSSSIEDITDSAASATAFSCGQKNLQWSYRRFGRFKATRKYCRNCFIKRGENRSCGHLVHHTCYASLFLCSCF